MAQARIEKRMGREGHKKIGRITQGDWGWKTRDFVVAGKKRRSTVVPKLGAGIPNGLTN